MKVLVYAPTAASEVKETANDLKSMQALVGGLIQPVPVRFGELYFWLVCNEDGLMLGLPENRYVGGHRLVGTFFICRPGFKSLKDSDVEIVKGVLA